jgi:amino acid transporter
MAFSNNQLLFAAFFLVSFIVFIAFAYSKDIKKRPDLFKGVWKVLIGIVATFILFYIAVKLSS